MASDHAAPNEHHALIGLDGPTVLVTGATGFIACHIIEQLLASDKKYIVRGTVRSLENVEKYAHVTRLSVDIGRPLGGLFAATLDEENSFDEAVQGCDVVMHTASPYVLNVADPRRDLVDPAVNGTLNVLNSAKKAGTVKTVVITSSMAAITDSPANGHVYTEADWNTESSLTRNPYYFSKVSAEKAALEWLQENENPFKIVFINPFMVVGPEHNPNTINTSNAVFESLLNGKQPGILNLHWGLVDVRDVAAAHILAFENTDAEGRYLVCAETRSMESVVAFLRANGFDQYELPTRKLNCSIGDAIVRFGAKFMAAGTADYVKTNLGRKPEFDHSKVERLGLVFRPMDETIVDTCEDMIANGHVARRGSKSTRYNDGEVALP